MTGNRQPATDPRPGGRYERKFVAEVVDRARIDAVVRSLPAHFREAYPQRYVNNLYLDTPGRLNYVEHVNGVSARRKLRIRWYGELEGRVERPALEIKTKLGLVGYKKAYPLPGFLFGDGFDVDAVLERARGDGMPGDLCCRVRCTVPSLVNRYRRSYYLSADGSFRLTVDDFLSFGLARPGPGFGLRRFMPERVILELKYVAADDHRADRVCSELPFRVSRSSKYCSGLQALAPLGI